MSSNTPFALGLAKGTLRYQRCDDCDAAMTGQRYACTACGSLRLAWRDAAGTGTVYAVSTVHRAPTEAFRPLVPYTLALVDLDEGPRVMGHATPGMAIGQRVVARAWDGGPQPLILFQQQPGALAA